MNMCINFSACEWVPRMNSAWEWSKACQEYMAVLARKSWMEEKFFFICPHRGQVSVINLRLQQHPIPRPPTSHRKDVDMRSSLPSFTLWANSCEKDFGKTVCLFIFLLLLLIFLIVSFKQNKWDGTRENNINIIGFVRMAKFIFLRGWCKWTDKERGKEETVDKQNLVLKK